MNTLADTIAFQWEMDDLSCRLDVPFKADGGNIDLDDENIEKVQREIEDRIYRERKTMREVRPHIPSICSSAYLLRAILGYMG